MTLLSRPSTKVLLFSQYWCRIVNEKFGSSSGKPTDCAASLRSLSVQASKVLLHDLNLCLGLSELLSQRVGLVRQIDDALLELSDSLLELCVLLLELSRSLLEGDAALIAGDEPVSDRIITPAMAESIALAGQS